MLRILDEMNEEHFFSLIKGVPAEDVSDLTKWHILNEHFVDRSTYPELGSSTANLEEDAAWLLIRRLAAQKMGEEGITELLKRCGKLLDSTRVSFLIRHLDSIRTKKKPGELTTEEDLDWHLIHNWTVLDQSRLLLRLQGDYAALMSDDPDPEIYKWERHVENSIRKREHPNGLYSKQKWEHLDSDLRAEYWQFITRGYLFQRLGISTHVDIKELGDAGTIPSHISAIICDELLRFEVESFEDPRVRLLGKTHKQVQHASEQKIDAKPKPTCSHTDAKAVQSTDCLINNPQNVEAGTVPKLMVDKVNGEISCGDSGPVEVDGSDTIHVLDLLKNNYPERLTTDSIGMQVWDVGWKDNHVHQCMTKARKALREAKDIWIIDNRRHHGYKLMPKPPKP